MLCEKAQNHWDNYLPRLEFAYNNQTDAATKHTPASLAYGEHPFSSADLLISDSSTVSNKAVSKFVEDFRQITSSANAYVEKSNNNRSVSYNKKDQIMTLT